MKRTFLCSILLFQLFIQYLGVVATSKNFGNSSGKSSEFKESVDPGFDLFFASNDREVENVPIYFKNPLPPWIKGTLIRNGLGRYEIGRRRFTHAFDAFAKLLSWKFPGNGTAFFSTKFIQSDFYKKSIEMHDIAPYLLFETVEPEFNVFQRFEALLRGIDNMNVNVYKFGENDVAVLNDFWKVYTIDPTSLKTRTSITPSIHVPKSPSAFTFLNFISSAHPLPEMGTPHHLSYLSSVNIIPGMKSRISLVRIKSSEEREIITSWEVDRVPYMHSFAATKNYVVFFACPYFINVKKMVRYAIPERSLDWEQESPTILYVVHIKSGKVVTMMTDTVFMMHQINAFERDGVIIVDISAYPNPDFVKNLEMKNLLDPVKRNQFNTRASVRRYTITLNTQTVVWKTFRDTETAPCASALDLPTINEFYRYRPYCFAYGVALKCNNVSLSDIAIVKKDLCGRGRDKMWKIANHYAVEAWFIPEPGGGKYEDDGYLVLPVLNGEAKSSYLAFIDARSMEMVNSAEIPMIVPFNLHGRFFDDLL